MRNLAATLERTGRFSKLAFGDLLPKSAEVREIKLSLFLDLRIEVQGRRKCPRSLVRSRFLTPRQGGICRCCYGVRRSLFNLTNRGGEPVAPLRNRFDVLEVAFFLPEHLSNRRNRDGQVRLFHKTS